MSRIAKLPLTLEHALLGFLRQRPMHAYEMHQKLAQSQALGLIWHVKQSQFYALIERLEDAGYLMSTTELQGTRPPRKILHLTPQGRNAYEEWMITPVEHGRDLRQEFLAKLFFANQEGPQCVAQLIQTQHYTCQKWLGDLHQQMETVSDQRRFDQLVLQFRQGQIAAILTWLDTCTVTLSAA